MRSDKIHIPRIGDQSTIELARLGLEIKDAAIAAAVAWERTLIKFRDMLQEFERLAKGSNASRVPHIKITRKNSQPYYLKYGQKKRR